MLEILTLERTDAAPKSARNIIWTAIALFAVFFVFLTLPLILDQQYWFLQFPSGMHFSFSNINEYVWGEGRDINGRFSVIKLYVVYVYTLLGIRLAPTLHISIQAYRAVIDAMLFISLFWSLNFFLKSLRIQIGGSFKYLSGQFIQKITIVTALVFGIFANLRWQHNGLIAYTILTYPPVIFSLIFAGAVIRILRSEIENGQDLKSNLRLIFIAAAVGLWANWYYELTTATIVTTAGAIALEWHQYSNTRSFKLAVKHLTIYSALFLAVFIPTRIMLANECARTTCYEGLKLSPSTMPVTFVQNLINPIPLVGVKHDLARGTLHSWASPMTLLIALTIGILGAIMLYQHVKKSETLDFNLDAKSKINLIVKIAFIPMVAGITGALIMSLSERAARLVQLGNPYRHTPATWLAYSLVISLVLILFFPSTKTWQRIFAVALVSIATVSSASHLLNVNQLWKDNQSLLTRDLYTLLLEDQYPEAHNKLACALQDSIKPGSSDEQVFIGFANRYTQWKFQTDFCVR